MKRCGSAEAAQEVIVVVCDEVTSITDSYAIIKVLSTERNVSRNSGSSPT